MKSYSLSICSVTWSLGMILSGSVHGQEPYPYGDNANSPIVGLNLDFSKVQCPGLKDPWISGQIELRDRTIRFDVPKPGDGKTQAGYTPYQAQLDQQNLYFTSIILGRGRFTKASSTGVRPKKPNELGLGEYNVFYAPECTDAALSYWAVDTSKASLAGDGVDCIKKAVDFKTFATCPAVQAAYANNPFIMVRQELRGYKSRLTDGLLKMRARMSKSGGNTQIDFSGVFAGEALGNYGYELTAEENGKYKEGSGLYRSPDMLPLLRLVNGSDGKISSYYRERAKDHHFTDQGASCKDVQKIYQQVNLDGSFPILQMSKHGVNAEMACLDSYPADLENLVELTFRNYRKNLIEHTKNLEAKSFEERLLSRLVGYHYAPDLGEPMNRHYLAANPDLLRMQALNEKGKGVTIHPTRGVWIDVQLEDRKSTDPKFKFLSLRVKVEECTSGFKQNTAGCDGKVNKIFSGLHVMTPVGGVKGAEISGRFFGMIPWIDPLIDSSAHRIRNILDPSLKANAAATDQTQAVEDRPRFRLSILPSEGRLKSVDFFSHLYAADWTKAPGLDLTKGETYYTDKLFPEPESMNFLRHEFVRLVNPTYVPPAPGTSLTADTVGTEIQSDTTAMNETSGLILDGDGTMAAVELVPVSPEETQKTGAVLQTSLVYSATENLFRALVADRKEVPFGENRPAPMHKVFYPKNPEPGKAPLRVYF